MNETEIDCDFHNVYMGSPIRSEYENRYGDHAYGRFLSNHFSDFLTEHFPSSATPPDLSEKQMNDLIFSSQYCGMQIELTKINSALRSFPDETSRQSAREELFTKAIKDFAVFAVRTLVNGERYSRYASPSIGGVLTEEYWQPKTAEMFGRVHDLRKIELADMAQQYEGDQTKVADLYDTDLVFSRVCNEAIYGFEYPDYSHKTAHEVFIELKNNWLATEFMSQYEKATDTPSDAPALSR